MNGIGGRTIAEAQERMSVTEYQTWLLYRQKYGGLNPVMRTEWGAALVSSVIANIYRDKKAPAFSLTDFAPHIGGDKGTEEISLGDAKRNWD
ncbi:MULTISPECIES: phage tail assembly protein T [Rosenbergiella]|uniref:Phage tail protein n=1 Tax=Rosenbergiella gaditana TaxID=2726987 RepID=A0ABS5SYN0_9GAMM|nr:MULTISPECIES: phage tail protein [Rosenbergiella]MBT0725159.1 phage tail protein [Rosenbergiella gaditana]